jgi:dolichyl-phosphate-mannose--protein O-mannosyl transferase
MGIVPWFIWEFSDRTMFYFYALPALPFLIMAIVYLFGMLIHTPDRNGPGSAAIRGGRTYILGVDRRTIGAVLLGVYILIIAATFAYFYPIYAGEKITYAQWLSRMWLGGRWI